VCRTRYIIDERSKRRKRNRFKASDGEAAADVEDEVYEDDEEEEEEEEEEENLGDFVCVVQWLF